MPAKQDRTGEEGRGDSWTGTSEESVDQAIRRAVDSANQPPGTWLAVGPIMVESVGDPDVGTYKATVTKI